MNTINSFLVLLLIFLIFLLVRKNELFCLGTQNVHGYHAPWACDDVCKGVTKIDDTISKEQSQGPGSFASLNRCRNCLWTTGRLFPKDGVYTY